MKRTHPVARDVSAAGTIRALGTVKMHRLTGARETEHRVRMLLALAARQLERGEPDAARATLIALLPEDFGRRARRAEGPLAVLHHRPTSSNELRVVLHAFEQLLPPV